MPGDEKENSGEERGFTTGKWSEKDLLERTISAGVYGKPQLRKEERRKYLGEFRERVIRALTLEQVHQEGVYPEIIEALKDPRAGRLVISKRADLTRARDYILLAHRQGLQFTTVDSPDYHGEVGLVVVAESAVDEEEIFILSPEEKLAEQGVPRVLAMARGQKLCAKCYRLIEAKAPWSLPEYRTLGWWDKLKGLKCPGNH